MLEYLTTRIEMLRDREDGQAMVEYALILGLVSVIAIAALTAIGTSVNGVLTAVQAALAAVPGA
jgi:pilus assembly protein Flp/PilA